jgi:nucleoside-diphosphate-sugar epimerase
MILITGGNAGIGLAFAERFLKAGNKVIVTGRREHALQKAKETFPDLITSFPPVISIVFPVSFILSPLFRLFLHFFVNISALIQSIYSSRK